MQINSNKQYFRYLLILCLSLALVLAQANRLHMHFESQEHAGVSAHAAAHSVLTMHNEAASHHHGQSESTHPLVIDVSPDNFITKINLLNPLLLVFLFFGLSLLTPCLIYIVRQRFYKITYSSCCYLFSPPLRAPPLN